MQVIEALFTHIEEPHDYLHIKHASIGITLDLYSHVTDGLHDKAAVRVAGVIFGNG
jgi:hypothetical protein